jgi:DNA-binding response OmpR family regulator
VDVALVRWPFETRRRQELSAEGVPRLLLVDPQAPPPVVDDPIEDWVRLPVSDADVRARVDTLLRRERVQNDHQLRVDHHGVLHVGATSTPLPPVEARLMEALVNRLGVVVSREALAKAGWPDGEPKRNVLDVRILRLRRRLDPLGLHLRTVRHRGYLLERLDKGVHPGTSA